MKKKINVLEQEVTVRSETNSFLAFPSKKLTHTINDSSG